MRQKRYEKGRKGQEENRNFSNLNFSGKRKSTKAQEEIVGFALIIIIVAVVILFLLSFSLKNSEKESVESYEVDSFIQAALQYTSQCEINARNQSVQDLIFDCVDNEVCSNEMDSCEVLNSTLRGIVGESWKTSQNTPTKGYELVVKGNNNEILMLKEGNATNNYKGGLQSLTKSSDSIEISLNVYY